MTHYSSIVVSGDLGSGKSTISTQLAERLGVRKISMGDVYREMAQSRGMSALQFNLHAELDEAVDSRIDELQKEIASSKERLVVDSRLAWFFFTDAFKVHLIVDPTIGAQRAMSRPASEVEKYSSALEAVESLQARSESERIRFLKKYDADKTRLRNYDLVVDTTRAGQNEVVESTIAAFEGTLGHEVLAASRPLLLLDPTRIYPSQGIRGLRGLWDSDSEFVASVSRSAPTALEPISVGYAKPYFYVVDGHRRLSAAIQGGFSLVSAALVAEGGEEVVGGLTSLSYFESEVSLSMVYDWDAAHNIELPLPPRLAALVQSREK